MNLMKKYREQVAYLFFGVLTTAVNYGVYFLLTFLGMYYVVANGIAIVISVLFAYGTNKKWVFQSRTASGTETLQEFLKFIGARAFSAALDMVAMIVLVSGIQLDDFMAKIIVGILVVVINYVTSKCFTFKNK